MKFSGACKRKAEVVSATGRDSGYKIAFPEIS